MAVRARRAQRTAEIRSVMARLAGQAPDLFQRRIVRAQRTRRGNGTGIRTEVSDGTQLAEGRGGMDRPVAWTARLTTNLPGTAERARWTGLGEDASSQRVGVTEISRWTRANVADERKGRADRWINDPNEKEEGRDEFPQHFRLQIESNRVE